MQQKSAQKGNVEQSLEQLKVNLQAFVDGIKDEPLTVEQFREGKKIIFNFLRLAFSSSRVKNKKDVVKEEKPKSKLDLNFPHLS